MCKKCEPEFNAWFNRDKKLVKTDKGREIYDIFRNKFLECWHEAICIGQQEGALHEDKIIQDMSESDLEEFKGYRDTTY